jgi:putative CocE/NonD family hydrolase
VKIKKETASLYVRDGTRLDADVYRPDSGDRFPVLLMRQPYGRAIASTVVYAHPSWYAARGYIVVVQDVRGRGTSQGEFRLFEREAEDGLETVEWAAQLPGSTGKVGMYGFSYQGMTQLYAASAKPSALKVLCPGMVGYNLYSDWAYENGAFCLQANFGWAVQLAAETARLQGDELAFNTLYTASRNLPFSGLSPQFNEILRKYAPSNFFEEWLNHPQFDEYWERLSPNLDGVDLPMLHIGGWFDPYLRGTLNLYQTMRDRTSPQYLIIGPWAHLPWGRKTGEIDYGAAANSPVDELQVRWCDRFLKGIETGILEEPSVRLWAMGRDRWQYFDELPNYNPRTYYLASNGLAGMREDAGQLVAAKAELMPDLPSESEDILVRDPWRPVPSLGGHAAAPAGAFDRSTLDCRSDILTYTSEPLAQELQIVGEGVVEIYCQTDAPSFDLCAVLSEVRSQGGVYNFTQGYIRVNFPCEFVQIPLQATCMYLARGSRLRLSLSADCFPAYALNLGTGEFAKSMGAMEAKIFTLIVKSGTHFVSKILLPLVESPEQEQ